MQFGQTADLPEIPQDAAVRQRRSLYATRGKRFFDLILGLCLLPVLAPVVLILGGITRLDGGPAFFGHTRIGQNGRRFTCWKIRTMVVDAESKLKQYLSDNPDAAREWARDYKLDKDPRITRFGRFLRRTSLDELPQLLNVLRGEMSFVGPRPIVEDELRKYRGYQWAYLTMKPGVTGLWQVSGRNRVSYDQRVRMDVSYMQRCAMSTDALIILRTAGAVLGRTGK